jgi:hypothetical protein
MSDQTVAAIARDLVKAMQARARSRLAEDDTTVRLLQTQLAQEVMAEASAGDVSSV